MPSTFEPQSQLDYTSNPVEKMQLAYELVRRNLKERADKHAAVTEKFLFTKCKTDFHLLVYLPFLEDDVPISNYYFVGEVNILAETKYRMWRIRRTNDGQPSEVAVHLGQMNKYDIRSLLPASDLEGLDDVFLGTNLPLLDLEGSVLKPMITLFTVESNIIVNGGYGWHRIYIFSGKGIPSSARRLAPYQCDFTMSRDDSVLLYCR